MAKMATSIKNKIFRIILICFSLISLMNLAYADIVFDTDGTGQNAVGYTSSTDSRFAQSFTANGETIKNITIHARKFGAGAEYYWSIVTDNSGEPSTTLYSANSRVTVDGTAFSTSGTDYTFDLDEEITPTSGTTLWVLVERTGVGGTWSTSDGIVIYSDSSTNDYGAGHFERQQSGSWADYNYDIRGSLGTYVAQNTPTINHNFTDYYNSENISIALNTSTNTNMSYFLNGSSEVTICNDCNISILNLTSLSEGDYNIILSSTDPTGEINTSVNFTIDLTSPVGNINISNEYNSYIIDFNSSCSDLNLLYCNISVNNQTTDLNSSSFTFTQNGNFSYNISAADQAGNTFSSTGYIFINPEQRFYFQAENGSLIEDFYFNGTLYNEYASINIYDLGLGNYTFEFSKIGYGKTNITFNFNLTSNINLTSAVQLSRIFVELYDRETRVLMNSQVDLTLEGSTFGKVFNTTTGNYTILESGFVPGDYTLSAEKDGYARAEHFFTYTGYEIATVKIYLLNNTQDDIVTVRRTVIDQNSVRLPGTVVKVMQYDPATAGYLYVDSGTTNGNGDAVFELEYNSITYKFVFTYQDITQEEGKNKITIFGLENPLYFKFDTSSPGVSNYDFTTNLEYDVTFNEINTSNSSGYFKYFWNDLDGIATQVCLTLEKSINNRFVQQNETCDTQATGIINTWVSDYNESLYRAIGYVYYDSDKIPLDTAYSSPTGDANAWEDLGPFTLVAVTFLVLLTAGIGFMVRPSAIFVGPLVILYFAKEVNIFKIDEATFWGLVIVFGLASWLIEKFNKENG